MTPVLQIVNIVKQFGTTTAVEDVSLDIAGNEFFALLGASGSGKTTLLRMLAGFETPTRGQILLDGADVSRVPPDKRPVNLMFQSYALFPHMTVRANISYGLEMERLARSEITARVDDILDVIQLTPFADRKPDQLSGGQKQRVALARALVKRPRVLLLDEPLGALDKKLELKRLQLEVGITFVIVTHDQEEALVMADRIAILKDGKLLQCGAPRDVYEHPVNRFAADFIGVMNFFPGQAAPGGVRLSDGSLIATDTGLQAGPALAAIRPERIRLAPGENTLSGTVRALAYHGLDLQLHVETPLSPKPVTVRLTADLAEAQSLEPGATVTLGWATKDTRIFPA
jgi:spermidine/putrescine transport system ATP-binding protein/putrescine transport system ATP-binding protein